MIVTVTLNPSLDMAYKVPHLVMDDVNRVADVAKTAGGKGLNVTRVLHQLGTDVIATGLIGGNIGNYLTDQLNETGVSHDFYNINGETRHSIAILHDDGKQTELLETGPTITPEELLGFSQKFAELSTVGDVLTLSGSVPPGVPKDYYQKLIAHTDKPVLLDTSGESLLASLMGEKKPFLIKPNLSEIQDVLDIKIDAGDLEQIKAALNNKLFKGVEWVVVTLGGQGAIAKHRDIFYQVSIPKIEVVSPVGSGDSTIAGLAYGISQGMSDEDLLKNGMVTGMLNTRESQTGWINVAHFDELFEQVKVVIVG